MSTLSRGPFRRAGTDCLAVILAGGLGTRMGSLSLDRPKHLLEIGGEPVIAHQLRWLAGHGVVDVVLATAHLADRFAPVLGDGSRWGVRLQYATEPSPLGTGGGLRFAVAARGDVSARGHVPDWIVVVNGDLLTAPATWAGSWRWPTTGSTRCSTSAPWTMPGRSGVSSPTPGVG